MAKQKNNSVEIRDNSGDRAYFAMIPFLVDDMGLSPYAVRLYLRIKRRAGETGKCFENTEHLAQGCNMAAGMVSKAKKELSDKGLITIGFGEKRHGHFENHVIIVNDIWAANMNKYSTCSPHEQVTPIHGMNTSYSPSERKYIPSLTGGNEVTKKTATGGEADRSGAVGEAVLNGNRESEQNKAGAASAPSLPPGENDEASFSLGAGDNTISFLNNVDGCIDINKIKAQEEDAYALEASARARRATEASARRYLKAQLHLHPAILAVEKLVGHQLKFSELLWKEIIARVGPKPNLQAMSESFARAIAKGHNPENLTNWLFDDYCMRGYYMDPGAYTSFRVIADGTSDIICKSEIENVGGG